MMLRNLRLLRAYAGMEEGAIREQFDGKAHVLTATFTKDVMEISCHWTKTASGGNGFIEYHTRVLKQ